MAYSQNLKTLKQRIISDTISSGTTTAAINLEGGTLCGVIVPASLNSTSFTITTCATSTGTFITVKDKTNTAYTVTTSTATAHYYIEPSVTAGLLQYIKIVFGSSETSKTVSVVTRNID